MGDSAGTTPPGLLALGRTCRFTKFAPATITRFCLRSTFFTTPVTPLPPPDMTNTVSPVSRPHLWMVGGGAPLMTRFMALRTHGLSARVGTDMAG